MSWEPRDLEAKLISTPLFLSNHLSGYNGLSDPLIYEKAPIYVSPLSREAIDGAFFFGSTRNSQCCALYQVVSHDLQTH